MFKACAKKYRTERQFGCAGKAGHGNKFKTCAKKYRTWQFFSFQI